MKQNDVERKCIVTGKILPKEQLLRFTVTPERLIVPDFKKKLPGKGIYVTNAKTVLQQAISKNLFAKATQGKGKSNSSLTEMTEQILTKRALDAISLSRKSGDLITGMDKVLEALKKNQIAFVLEAKGAGADGLQRVMLAAKDLEIYRLFTVEELDKALNKTNTVHVAFKKGKMAQMVQNEFKKLSDFLNL